MPFTLAHTAAILPFLRQALIPVVPIALVAGAMAPDLPYFVLVRPSNAGWFTALLSGDESHQATHLLTVGLPLALILVVFLSFVAKPVRWALPDSWIPDRPAALARPSTKVEIALWTFHSLLLGLLTHLVWDSFTHSTGWVVRHMPILSVEPLAGLPIFRILQHSSTLAGLTILVLWYFNQRAPASTYGKTDLSATNKMRIILLGLVTVVPAAVSAILGLGAAPVVEDAAGTEVFLQFMILRGGAALIVALAIYGFAWHTVALIRKSRARRTTNT